jgi:hypothetical protein
VNERGRLVDQPSYFCRRLVAQHRSWTGVEQRSPQLRIAVNWSSERRVHAPINPPPSSRPDLGPDTALQHPGIERLLPRYDAALVARCLPESGRDVILHVPSMTTITDKTTTCGALVTYEQKSDTLLK